MNIAPALWLLGAAVGVGAVVVVKQRQGASAAASVGLDMDAALSGAELERDANSVPDDAFVTGGAGAFPQSLNNVSTESGGVANNDLNWIDAFLQSLDSDWRVGDDLDNPTVDPNLPGQPTPTPTPTPQSSWMDFWTPSEPGGRSEADDWAAEVMSWFQGGGISNTGHGRLTDTNWWGANIGTRNAFRTGVGLGAGIYGNGQWTVQLSGGTWDGGTPYWPGAHAPVTV